MIHTVKGFLVVTEAAVFLDSLAFSMIWQMLAIWSLAPPPFLNSACISGSSQYMYCWSLSWRILSNFTSIGNEHNCLLVWTFFGIALLWNWNENWLFKKNHFTSQLNEALKVKFPVQGQMSRKFWNHEPKPGFLVPNALCFLLSYC